MVTELNLGNQISKYYKSFSGTDTLAFIMMPGSLPVVIGSLTTISYSMYRNKKPVINIGRTNINGVTRGSRIFAGTMIFTLINQHWLKELQEQVSLLTNYDELKVDELPLFDIMIVSANEYGNYVTMYIYGIDFTDEGQTISVEDLFTENTFSFIARDISVFKAGKLNAKMKYKDNDNNSKNVFTQKYYVLKSSSTSLEELAKLEQDYNLVKLEHINTYKPKEVLSRELYYSSSKTMIGNDVAKIQELLNQTKLMTIEVNGIFDEKMDEAIRKYQSLINADINGIVDDKLYNHLINETVVDSLKLGLVVNKYGAFVYKNASYNSDIVDTKQYREQVVLYDFITSNDDKFKKWYKIDTGYVAEEDIYSSYYTGNVIEFPTIEYGDESAYVTIIQSALAIIYNTFTTITGVYDYETQEQIKILQEENDLQVTGIVDYSTWLVLQSLSGNVSNKISNDNFKIIFNTLPGIYTINKQNTTNDMQLFDVTISCDNYINIKISAICYYSNNASETLTKIISLKEESIISLKELSNAFVYNPKYGETPYQIDYIIYPYNKKPYKWTIMYS